MIIQCKKIVTPVTAGFVNIFKTTRKDTNSSIILVTEIRSQYLILNCAV